MEFREGVDMRFPEDDEMLDQEEIEERINGIDKEMSYMAEEQHRLKRMRGKKQLDPVTAKLVELAQNAGHALGANEALGNRVTFLEKRIKARDEWIDEHEDYDEIKARMLAAEATIARSKKRRSR